MEKKNIAFVIHSLSSGGAERVVSILSNALSSHFNVYIITIEDSPSFYELKETVTLLHCINGLKPSKNIFEAINSNFKIYKVISKILKQRKIDLCIGFMTANNILATLAGKRLGIPVIISERNNPYLQSASTSAFWKILRRIVYPMADVLIVQTLRVKSFYTSFIKDDKMVIIPNPIKTDFDRMPEVKKQNIVLNVGSLEHQKGHDVLIRAFSKAKLEGWQLHIAGEGRLRPKLMDLITELRLEKLVFLLGKKSNIIFQYASSKIFAFTSRYEGFPNALLEAMNMGLPCISTDCPTGPDEMIQNELNGYLVAVDDIDALTLKLQTLAANDNLRLSMGQAAQKSVEQYSTENIVGIWKNLIDRLLGQHL